MPEELLSPIRQFAEAWVRSPLRPRVAPEVETGWKELVEQWCGERTLPLYIRKSSELRGQELTHSTGRRLIPCDNTTAVWAFTLAVEGECPSLAQVTALVRNGEIPVAFTGLRGRFARFYAANWKLAHIDKLGLGTRERLENLPIDTLEAHFRKLVLPSNMFAVPKVWAGLGEIPEVIEAIRRSNESSSPHHQAVHLVNEPQQGSPARTVAPAVQESQHDSNGPDSNTIRVSQANTYRASRLLFKASVIDPLMPEQAFRVETPDGIYEMTKADFGRTFENVVNSSTYQGTGVYSYSRTPAKARQYLLRTPTSVPCSSAGTTRTGAASGVFAPGAK